MKTGYHLNKRHWITATLDDSLPDELVFGLLEVSYELVVDGLPKRERDLLRSALEAEEAGHGSSLTLGQAPTR